MGEANIEMTLETVPYNRQIEEEFFDSPVLLKSASAAPPKAKVGPQ